MAAKPLNFKSARGPDGIVVYAIGDVHGRLDLLTRMHEEIAADRVLHGKDWRIIHLGDYVDRGPQSRGVIDLLVEEQKSDGRIVALCGNHDVGFLDFLADGDPVGIFARYGGVQTAQSYGVALDFSNLDLFDEGHAALVAAVPDSHVDFMKSLKLSVQFGDFFFCHAGIRPGIALDKQDPNDLMWIRDEFHDYEGPHPKVIVHGHTPTEQPELLANRVNIDTGAFYTGRLTALVIDGADKQVMAVQGTPR